ncbi:MAG TPA: molybdate ABC transporter substrate-binding protein [Acidimicrobiia bacterium]|nr:molybdate ABC transporter substrate-binding protein [Acidimicrobiia bacterium]
MSCRDTTVLLWAVAFLVACQGGENPASRDEVVVSAAASLTDAFTALETTFESAHPEFDVVLNLGGSSLLRQQIIEGAPVDVFASANITNMDQVVKAGEATNPQIFAANHLVIAVPAGNPAGITGLSDFANSSLLIGLCFEEAPCGDFARRVLANAGVVPSLDTWEPDVRALLTKVEAGELDAGITFVTDVLSAEGAVEGVEIPDQFNVKAEYPIAVLTRAPHPEGGASFVEFVLSTEGRSILTSFGFLPP